jgi:glycine/D-amino acid oxidase-like deaminating enzyme
MRTRYGLSPWIAEFPSSRRPDYPRLKGEIDRDVVIIGGGLTGCAAAYACATAGIRALVLEAGRIGQQASGRGAGLLLPEPGPSFRAISELYGIRAARTVFQSWRRAALDAAALLRRLGIRCGLSPQDALIAGGIGDERMLRRELEARVAAGLEATWLSPKLLRAAAGLDGAGAVKVRDAAGIDPYRACLGIAAAAVKRGVPVYERTAVRTVRVGSKHVEVVGEGALVRAQTVVVATGIATAEYRQLRRHFSPREAYVVMSDVMPAAMRKALGPRNVVILDTRSPRHRIRFTADDRLIVAGADQPATAARTRDAVLVQRTGQLMYEVLTMNPAISGLVPAFGWDVPYGETADGLPYVGAHRNFPRHLFALGMPGDSVTGSFLAARSIVRQLAGAPEKSDAVFAWTR